MDGVLDAAQNIDAAAGRMHSTTSSALWNIASFIPVLGSDVKSVQTISATLDTLANDALTPVAEALKGQGLNTLFTEKRIHQHQPANQRVHRSLKFQAIYKQGRERDERSPRRAHRPATDSS